MKRKQKELENLLGIISKGLYGWAVFNEKYKYISHYEETEKEAFRTCYRWNFVEKREF